VSRPTPAPYLSRVCADLERPTDGRPALLNHYHRRQQPVAPRGRHPPKARLPPSPQRRCGEPRQQMPCAQHRRNLLHGRTFRRGPIVPSAGSVRHSWASASGQPAFRGGGADRPNRALARRQLGQEVAPGGAGTGRASDSVATRGIPGLRLRCARSCSARHWLSRRKSTVLAPLTSSRPREGGLSRLG